jgi:hypothetical protein
MTFRALYSRSFSLTYSRNDVRKIFDPVVTDVLDLINHQVKAVKQKEKRVSVRPSDIRTDATSD